MTVFNATRGRGTKALGECLWFGCGWRRRRFQFFSFSLYKTNYRREDYASFMSDYKSTTSHACLSSSSAEIFSKKTFSIITLGEFMVFEDLINSERKIVLSVGPLLAFELKFCLNICSSLRLEKRVIKFCSGGGNFEREIKITLRRVDSSMARNFWWSHAKQKNFPLDAPEKKFVGLHSGPTQSLPLH